jgi:phosphoesterase RecJ-like protein
MYQEFKKIIEEFDSIILLSHFNPDGDAYGSQIGLRDTLRANYKDKKIFACGSGLKSFFNEIGFMDEVSDEIFKNSLVILLDSNELYRFEDQRLHLAKKLVMIDHHVHTEDHDFYSIINENVSSTCELVTNIIKLLGLFIPKKAANALMLGIITDSGRFQYSKNHRKLFQISSFLCSKGARPEKLFKLINILKPTDLLVRQFIAANMKMENGIISVGFKTSDLDRLNITSSKALSFVNSIGNVEGYPIWMMYAEEHNGNIVFEFRSNKYIVQPVAYKYGGGGHQLAAGVTIANCSIEQKEAIIQDLRNLLEE